MKKAYICILIILFLIVNIVGFTGVFLGLNPLDELTNVIDKEDNIDYAMNIKREIEKSQMCTHEIMYIGNYADKDKNNISFEYYSNLYGTINVDVNNNKIVVEIPRPRLDKLSVYAKDVPEYNITENLYDEIRNYVENTDDLPLYDLAVKNKIKYVAEKAIGKETVEKRNIIIKYYN